jgi:hypothetical protein
MLFLPLFLRDVLAMRQGRCGWRGRQSSALTSTARGRCGWHCQHAYSRASCATVARLAWERNTNVFKGCRRLTSALSVETNLATTYKQLQSLDTASCEVHRASAGDRTSSSSRALLPPVLRSAPALPSPQPPAMAASLAAPVGEATLGAARTPRTVLAAGVCRLRPTRAYAKMELPRSPRVARAVSLAWSRCRTATALSRPLRAWLFTCTISELLRSLLAHGDQVWDLAVLSGFVFAS